MRVEDATMRSDGRTRELPSGKSHEPPELTSMVEVHTMATQRLVIPGIVKNGLVVPQNDTPLPEGAHVDILIGAADVTPALQSEYDQWEKASDEAWAMIGQWEVEDR
jgi:hypothetical protein